MEHSDRAEFAQSIVRIVALHDENTAVHLHATGTLARRIAERLGLDEPTSQTTELAAMLHDVGKVGVRRAILCKRAELSEIEWVEMRLHAENGADVLAAIPLLAHLAPIVRAHHERIDGCGYPDRLRGEEIPLEARVIAVADAFHALTTDRPYRRAITTHAALGVLASAAGPQFDVDVVAATLDLLAAPRPSRKLSA
jgi:HD-GYP domain-containing protein (c-di-GMP phosphodiesterase class II)